MSTSKNEVIQLRGVLEEGKDCLIIRQYHPLRTTLIGERVENIITGFVGKNVTLTLNIHITTEE